MRPARRGVIVLLALVTIGCGGPGRAMVEPTVDPDSELAPSSAEPVRTHTDASSTATASGEPEPASSSSQPVASAPASLAAFETPDVAFEVREGGLEVHDHTLGEGPSAELDDHLLVHYILTLPDGTELDRSHDRGPGLELVLGETGLISGFTAGLIGAREGMLRTLVIPPTMAYGHRAVGAIPADATLIFHVEILLVDQL